VGGLTASTGGAATLRFTVTDCGLPVIVMPLLSTPASEIVPVNVPAASAAEVTVTVNLAGALLVAVAEAGDTESHVPPPVVVAVGVTVTLPAQVPMTPIVKDCVAGLRPASLVKVSVVAEGACRVHGGSIFRVIPTTSGLPMGACVTLSIALIVTLPVYVLAASPVKDTPTAVLDGEESETVPVDGVVVSHVPPAGVVAVVAVQLRGFAQVPLALIATGWVAGAA